MIGIFRKDILPVGGIETWLYYLVKLYGDEYPITIYYEKCAKEQLKRLKKYAKAVKYTGQQVKLDKAIFCFDMMGLDKVEADEYIHVVHADYNEINVKFKPSRPFDKIYAVSQIAADSFEQNTGIEAEVMYNPVAIEKSPPLLKLISPTRLSEEKGLWRIQQMVEDLDASGIPYRWDIFTNDKVKLKSNNVVIHKPQLNMAPYIQDADYLVQLSDTESYCYSVVEALTLGTPVICTELPVLEELGIRDVEHGIIVSLDDWQYEKYIPRMTTGAVANYRPPDAPWDEVFEK